jgi:carbonic anhydrase/acetyltransferase-like protein (isoleucine patch superfamily)
VLSTKGAGAPRLSLPSDFDSVASMLIPFDGRSPQIDPSAYVQASAQIIGDVVLGAQSSVWFNVVVRGDVYPIRIGARTNIQDNSTVHVTGGRWATIVGDDVTVGHAAVLHGCRIGDRCLVGIGAIVMDDVQIGDDCLIAAGSLVTPGTKIPPSSLVMGSPAKVARRLRPDELASLKQSALNYIEHAAHYRAQHI